MIPAGKHLYNRSILLTLPLSVCTARKELFLEDTFLSPFLFKAFQLLQYSRMFIRLSSIRRRRQHVPGSLRLFRFGCFSQSRNILAAWKRMLMWRDVLPCRRKAAEICILHMSPAGVSLDPIKASFGAIGIMFTWRRELI